MLAGHEGDDVVSDVVLEDERPVARGADVQQAGRERAGGRREALVGNRDAFLAAVGKDGAEGF